MLKIQFTDRRKPAMWLVDSTIKIGSASECEIQINDPSIDAVHAELVVSQETILLKNISKKRSVFVNDIPVVSEHQLNAWDTLRLGDNQLEIIDPLNQRTIQDTPQKPQNATVIRSVVSLWTLKGATIPLEGKYFSVTDGMVIGREDASDIRIPLSYVSRRHAKLCLRNSKLFIDDMDSSNGTYVNGERITSKELFSGDELRLDEFVFHVIGPEDEKKKSAKLADQLKSEQKNPEAENQSAKNRVPKLLEELSQKVFLHGISKNVAGQTFEINQIENHLSRLLGHHLSRTDESVSARHVYLYATDMGWQIKNNGAAGGLLVNEKMCTQAMLQEGDKITIGGITLVLWSHGFSGGPLFNANKNNKNLKLGLSIAAVVFLLVVIYFVSS